MIPAQGAHPRALKIDGLPDAFVADRVRTEIGNQNSRTFQALFTFFQGAGWGGGGLDLGFSEYSEYAGTDV